MVTYLSQLLHQNSYMWNSLFFLLKRRLSHRSSHSTCAPTAITKDLGTSRRVGYYVQANAIADLVKVGMKTSKGQWRDSYSAGLRVDRCQPCPTRSHHTQAGRQNLSTSLGIKRNPSVGCWPLFLEKQFSRLQGQPLSFCNPDDLANFFVEVETQDTVQHTSSSATFLEEGGS